MTPSGWHDDTQSRDAGHDELQAQVWRFLKTQPDHTTRRLERGGPEVKFQRTAIHFEYAFYKDGRIISFGDVATSFMHDEKKTGRSKTIRHLVYYVFEIKPKIYSVGGVVRQCRALESAVFATITDDDQLTMNPVVNVIPVVPKDDPKLPLLKEVSPYRVEVWDLQAGKPHK